MFYYVSFLRPPPLQASATPSEPVLITPHICNDLRTEYLDDPVDIYYTWAHHHPARSDPPRTSLARLAKLTSWRASTAYKAIPVPRPPPSSPSHADSEPSQSWRLVLTCGPTQNDQLVSLGVCDPETSLSPQPPFAVASMPVVFPRRPENGKNSARKAKAVKYAAKPKLQERIARSYVLPRFVIPSADDDDDDGLEDRRIVFDIVEQTSFDLDKKVWDSGIGLSSWLARFFSGLKSADHPEGLLSDLRDALFGTGARHILELGAGTGIVAITLAILRSTLDLSDQPGSIVTTDLPSAMPILRENVCSNQPLTRKCTPRPVVLDWERDELARPLQDQLKAGLDVILMADVTYNTASFPALIATLSRLIQSCKHRRNGRPPLVLLGYKERHPDERSLWDRARDIDVNFQQIAEIRGAGGNPVEIWLG